MIPRPRRIGHVGLVARDLERMVSFYCEVIGMQVSDRMSFPESSPIRDGVWLRIGNDHHVISMFDLREGDEARPPQDSYPIPTHGLHHIAFEMASFADLRRAARVVREQSLPLQGMRTGGPGCQLRLYVWDPEGNIVELYWALDQIGWDGRTRPYPPVENIDLEQLDVDRWLQEKSSELDSAAVGATAGESLMASSLYEQGLAKRRQVVGAEYVDRVLDQIDDFDREWQRLLTEYCWGEVWGGEALGDRQRSLNNLCLLAACGRSQEFETHFRGALRNGCTLSELRETLHQIAVYVGVPAGVECFRIAKRVLAEPDTAKALRDGN